MNVPLEKEGKCPFPSPHPYSPTLPCLDELSPDLGHKQEVERSCRMYRRAPSTLASVWYKEATTQSWGLATNRILPDFSPSTGSSTRQVTNIFLPPSQSEQTEHREKSEKTDKRRDQRGREDAEGGGSRG